MKPKFGREMVLLTLPVVLIGSVAWWASRGVDAPAARPPLKIKSTFANRYEGTVQIQISVQRTGRTWIQNDKTTPHITKVWATDEAGRALRVPINLKPAGQCKPEMSSNGRWYFIYDFPLKPSATLPRKILVHHVLLSVDSMETPVVVVLKRKEHY